MKPLKCGFHYEARQNWTLTFKPALSNILIKTIIVLATLSNF